MIDQVAFSKAWAMICRRFGREIDNETASDYLGYLDDVGMSTERMLAGVAVIWATNEFFPKPSDFLKAEAAVGWDAIQAYSKIKPHSPLEVWKAARAKIPDRAYRAIEALGGITVLGATSNDRIPFLRRDYFDAFAAAVITDTHDRALLVGTLEPSPHAIEAGPGARVAIQLHRGSEL